MSAPAPRRPSPLPAAPVTATGPLRWAVHALVLVLLVFAATRAATAGPARWSTVLCAALVALVYAGGSRWRAVRTSGRSSAAWLVALLVSWVALLVLTPDAVYLAFPFFFLLLLVLPRVPAMLSVALTTAVAVAGFAWHQDQLAVAMVVGPVLGAAVAVATVFAYQAVQEESERRQRLLVQLERTRTELAEAERRAGVLDERERLAREIHDTLAQGLTSIQLLLAAATRSLAAEVPDAARASDLVEHARVTARENLQEARRFVRALAPPDLEGATLAAALDRLCASTTTRAGIPVTFHEVGQVPPLPTAVEVALLRVVQGALGNVVAHARASRAEVTLTGTDATVMLDVVDDGVGFDVEADRARTTPSAGGGGFGLRSMRSRVAELGGVLDVESRAGHGTAVSVALELAGAGSGVGPLPQPSRGPAT